jgi:hypothetical protein
VNKFTIFIGALFLQVVCANVAFASDHDGKVVEKPVAADTPEKFAQTEAQIRADMAPGGRYEFIKPDEKAKAEADMTQMDRLLQKSGSVNAMTQAEKLELYNTQERLNGILTHNDTNRLVCERNTPLGTHIPVTTCKTVGGIERERREAQKTMQDSLQIGGKCAGSNCRGN